MHGALLTLAHVTEAPSSPRRIDHERRRRAATSGSSGVDVESGGFSHGFSPKKFTSVNVSGSLIRVRRRSTWLLR